MARLVKSFIGGIASKVTGGDVYDTEDEEDEEQKEENHASSEGVEERKMPQFSSSEEEEEDEDTFAYKPPSKMGTLLKWTNYLSGWQDRYVVVRDGVLSYYKSEIDLQYGCRGSISLQKVKVFLHEFDELRFDIRAHDCTYFFRSSCTDEKQSWVDVIESNKKYIMESGIGKGLISRQGSILSLSGLSQASTSSFKTSHGLQVKLAEMETYRDILCKQIDILQVYFDACAETTANSNTGVNGIVNSTESIDELPETLKTEQDNETQYLRSHEHHVSMPSSPLTRSSDNHRPYGNSLQSSNSAQHSPIIGRITPKGHRRTGSDPFAFRQLPPPSHGRSPQVRFSVGGNGLSNTPDSNQIDFRGEAITFKATTAGILSSLSHCIDYMSKREEYWQKKFEKEQERRRKAERAAHSALNGPRVRAYEYAGPDFQEGPHSALNEDEFFDALEMAYQEDELESGQTLQKNSPVKDTDTKEHVKESGEMSISNDIIIEHKSHSGVEHRLTPLVNSNVSQYAKYIFEPVDTSSGNWQLAHEDTDMKVYRRELEEDGVVVDPLKAQYIAKGVSAIEVIRYFFEKDTRLDWEGTIESFSVLETLAEDSIIFHQLHKRVWPSTQRETVFCSHLCTLTNAPQPKDMIGHTWMVSNFSLDHPQAPVTSKMIRATLNVGMVCQTITNKPVEPGKEYELSRDDVSCKIIYAANVNPGGWAPPSVVRSIGKREICKFLKKFSSCAQKACSDSPLTI